MKTLDCRKATAASVCLLVGVFLGRIVSYYQYFAIVMPFVVLAIGFMLRLFTKKTFLLVLCVAFALGAAASVIDARAFGAQPVEGEYRVIGRVCGTRSDGKTVLGELSFDGEEKSGKAVVKIGGECALGTVVSFDCEAETYNTDLFDGYSAALYCDGIYYKLTKKGEADAEPGELTVAEKAKKRITDVISLYMSEENAGIMKSLLFGDKSDLPEETGKAINGVGLAHIFAVSGLHIGFLAALFMTVLRKLRIRRDISLAVVCAVLLGYGAVTGFPSGVKRATIMLFIAQIAKLTARKNDSLTTLALSAAIITLTNPRELFDLGFIMSFAAVLGIICFYKPIYRGITKRIKNKFFVGAAKILSTTLAANAFILPISFNVFGSFSPYAPLANMIILPIVSILFPVAAFAAVFTLVWYKIGVAFYATSYALRLIWLFSEQIYSLPHSSIAVGSMGIATAFYVIALVVLSPFVRMKKKYKYPTVGALGAAVLVFAFI